MDLCYFAQRMLNYYAKPAQATAIIRDYNLFRAVGDPRGPKRILLKMIILMARGAK
jgi:hypothetical protein